MSIVKNLSLDGIWQLYMRCEKERKESAFSDDDVRCNFWAASSAVTSNFHRSMASLMLFHKEHYFKLNSLEEKSQYENFCNSFPFEDKVLSLFSYTSLVKMNTLLSLSIVLESCINRIFEEVIDSEKEIEIREDSYRKIIRILDIDLDEVKTQKLKEELLIKHISFPTRCDEIYRLIDSSKYQRDIKEDKKILLCFYGLRNAMHDNMISNKSENYDFKTVSFQLIKGEPIEGLTPNNLFILISLMFDVYKEIAKTIKCDGIIRDPNFDYPY